MCNDNIMEKATACIGDLDYDYNLPSLICNKCLENLDNFFEFRNRCLQSEFLLNYYIEQIFQSKQTKKFKSTNLKVNLNNNYNPSPVEGKGIKVQVRCDNSKLPSHVPPIEFENVNTQNEIVIIEDSDFEEVDDIFLEEEEDYNGAQSIFGNLRDNLKRKFDEISEPLNKTVDNSASIIGAHRKQTRDVFSPNIVTNIMERVKLQKRKVQLERSNNANVEGEKLTTPMDIPLITENNPNSSITPPLSPQNSSIIPPTIPLNSNITLPISPPNSGIKQQIVPLKFKTKSPCNPPNYSIKPVVSSSNPILKPQIIRLNSNVKPQVSSSKPQLRIFNKSDWYNLEKSTGRSCIYRHEIPTPTPASEISTITDLENDITCHHITYKKADSELLQQLSDTKLSSTDDT
ncbi:hypothetical protein FQA39_LY10754 [Lamprigera yunnana]|nr:hypothetical protein FQA39_LY10754 [Lamprigera yunnana]